LLSGRSLVGAQRCRTRDRPSKRGGSAVPARCVPMAIPTASHSARPALLHYRCCWRPPHPTARHPPASKLSRWLCAGKHSLVNAPARHKTGTDRPSGGLQAADHSWCQSRQGGLCSTPIDTIPTDSPLRRPPQTAARDKIALAAPPLEPGAGSRDLRRASGLLFPWGLLKTAGYSRCSDDIDLLNCHLAALAPILKISD